MAKKEKMLGAGISGILSGGGRPVATKAAAEKENFYIYRRGRPRNDEPNPNDGKVFRKTSFDLEVGLYRRIREMSQEERIPIKDLVHKLLESGYELEAERLAKENV